jgi:hypothetical protein
MESKRSLAMDVIEQLELLRARLVEMVKNKQNFCDQDVIALSQELDVLIVRLQTKEQKSNLRLNE